jgi:hypothetical protein
MAGDPASGELTEAHHVGVVSAREVLVDQARLGFPPVRGDEARICPVQL